MADVTIGGLPAAPGAPNPTDLVEGERDPAGTPSSEKITWTQAASGTAFSDTYQAINQTINAQTGNTYTPVLSDNGKMVTCTNASSIIVTLPQDSDVAIPVGGRVDFGQLGAGQVGFSAGSGATINVASSFTANIAEQYGVVTAYKQAANTWWLFGNLAAA